MPCSKGVINKICPSRDSTRIVKHTFDGAKIGIISESCKYFAFYFHFLPPRTFNSHFFCIFATSIPTPLGRWVRTATYWEASLMLCFWQLEITTKNDKSRTSSRDECYGCSIYNPECAARLQPHAHFWVHCILTSVGIQLCSFTCQGRGKPRVADGQMRIPRFLYAAGYI